MSVYVPFSLNKTFLSCCLMAVGRVECSVRGALVFITKSDNASRSKSLRLSFDCVWLNSLTERLFALSLWLESFLLCSLLGFLAAAGFLLLELASDKPGLGGA